MTQTQTTEEGELPPGQRLCVACGLCCKGVWFSNALMSEDEVAPTLALGLTVKPPDLDGQRKFALPCHHHKGGCCSIYGSWRPTVCGTYRCALLVRVEQGDVEIGEALQTVATAKAMAEDILAETGPVEGGLVGDAFLELAGSSPPAGAQGLSALSRLNAGVLRVIYLQHFDNSALSQSLIKPSPE